MNAPFDHFDHYSNVTFEGSLNIRTQVVTFKKKLYEHITKMLR